MEQGFILDVRCPNIGQALPASTEDYTATLMFGGPQSAFEDHIPCIPEEIRWIDTAINGAAPFVGVVCHLWQFCCPSISGYGSNPALRREIVDEELLLYFAFCLLLSESR